MTDSDNKSSPVVGIDLGTTYSCLACWNESLGRAEVIPTPSGRTMPSWVGFTDRGKVVGLPAKQQVSANPKNTVFDVKRIIGRSFHDEVVSEESKQFPYRVVEGSAGEPRITVQWRGKEKHLAPEEVSAMILSELRIAAEAHLGCDVKDAVITVPAHFNNLQRQATKDAGRIAGLNVRRIINEPTAAALSYGLHEKSTNDSMSKSNVVIFDLGGGTFDVSVLVMNEGVFEVKATGGDTHLGGEDFDNTIFDWLMKEMSPEVSTKVMSNARSQARLRRGIENAKKALSSSSTHLLEVDALVEGFDFSVELSREKFNELNSSLFQRCIETVKSVLVDAEASLEEVSDIVLVGGSTRIPYLQEALFELFDKRIELCKTVHPDEAVAIGAAVQGHILASGGRGGGQDLQTISTDLLLLDVTPLSLGIELEGRLMSTLIKRNTAIPCRKTRTYSTVSDWQTRIDVVIYEGERPSIDANNKLGSFVISGVERARAGEPKVDVTFALDANGILNVSAVDQVTGAEAKATIKAEKGRLSDAEIERMVEEAEQYRREDAELAVKLDYKTSLEEAIFAAQSIEQNKTIADESAEKELADLFDWLELDSDMATMEEMKVRGRQIEDRWGLIIK